MNCNQDIEDFLKMKHYEACQEYVNKYLAEHDHEPKFSAQDLVHVQYIASLEYMRGYADGSVVTLNKIKDKSL